VTGGGAGLDLAAYPPWLAPWLRAMSLAPPPREARANCAACVMCSDDDWTVRHPLHRYRVDLRCCTFTPELANFVVGGMLANPETVLPEAMAALQRRIDSEEGTPMGLVCSPADDARYEGSVGSGGFGRDPALRCPFYEVDGGRCGIWAWRNATCATWHCRHERGKVGMGMWAMQRKLLGGLEDSIAAAALAAVAPELDPEDGSGWDGDRRALYLATWAWVRDADPAVVLPTLGEDVAMMAAMARRTLQVHARRGLPERATATQVSVIEELGEFVRIDTYTSVDTLVVPRALVPLLPRFDGRAVAEVRAEIEAEGLALTDSLLQRLFDFDVLS
jgi:hypothetical protein